MSKRNAGYFPFVTKTLISELFQIRCGFFFDSLVFSSEATMRCVLFPKKGFVVVDKKGSLCNFIKRAKINGES